MRKFLIFITMVIMFSSQVFATTTLDLNTKFEEAETSINAEIKEAKGDLLNKTYPVGSVYITTENISRDDVGERLGGEWVQIKDSFLWARGEEDNVGDTGGKSTYNLSALLGRINSGMGTEYNNSTLAFQTSGLPSYFGSPNFTVKPEEEEDALFPGDYSFGSSIAVTERNASSTNIKIMPPYTAVKMFRRKA